MPLRANSCRRRAGTSAIAISSPSSINGKIALLFKRIRVIHVLTAVITAEGD
jgi:hypothetical protein